jgi:hypothetical protein
MPVHLVVPGAFPYGAGALRPRCILRVCRAQLFQLRVQLRVASVGALAVGAWGWRHSRLIDGKGSATAERSDAASAMVWDPSAESKLCCGCDHWARGDAASYVCTGI